MADTCIICETRNPNGGTNHLVLNGGALWIEFCKLCGETEKLSTADGAVLTLNQIFDRCNAT